MTKVVECWTDLAENVETLSSLVCDKQHQTSLSGCTGLSIVKLETQIKSLKRSFNEKQNLILDLDSLAPEVKNILDVKS